jgi:signal transduction histidine kinase
MNQDVLFTGLSALLVLSLGGLVLVRGEKQNISNKMFFGFTIAIFIWMVSSLIATYVPFSSLQPVVNIGFAASVWIAYFFLTFCITFVNQHKQKVSSLLFFTIPPLLISILCLFGKVATAVSLTTQSFKISPGSFYPFFAAYLLLYAVPGIAALWRAYVREQGKLRTQIFYIFVGTATYAFLAILFSIVLPGIINNPNLYKGGIYSIAVFIAATAYAIVAHQLFDIRLVIKKTVIFTTLVAGSFVIYAAIIVLFSRIFQQQGTTTAGYIINLLAALAVGASFEPIRKWISERTDKWLFKKEYEEQVVISDLSKRLNDVIALDEALEIVMQTIVRVLHLRHSVTYVFQRGEENTFAIKRVKQVGYDTEARLLLEDRDFTVVYFSEHPATVQVQDLAMEMERQKELLRKNPDPELTRQNAILQAVVQKLVSLEIAVVVPLHLNGQPIGLILLSEKLNGEGYHSGDLGLLEVVGGQAISSIQKAKLYEGDQMKSEFVSIASHELLTPISAIEGYLSMILEEGIGQVDPQARDYLTKVFTSAKRLSLLIKDLLSVSRIESGKMKIDPQQLDMNKMVTDTIDQLRFMASDKGLQLDFTRVDGLPPVWADPDRTMQVMVNLVSNAIKYTPKGNVTITVKADGKGFVTTAVKDTGLGMTKDAMKHRIPSSIELILQKLQASAAQVLACILPSRLLRRWAELFPYRVNLTKVPPSVLYFPSLKLRLRP